MAASKKDKNEEKKGDDKGGAPAKASSSKSQKVQEIHLPQMEYSRIHLRLNGVSPLVMHAFGEKARKEIRDKQQGKAKKKKDPKDPRIEFNEARYRLEDGRDAMPTISIKKALVSACRMVDGVPMTLVRQIIHVEKGAEFVPIAYAPGRFYGDDHEPLMREDTVRVGGKGPGTGTADLRYRPEYHPWMVDVTVEFLKNMITPDSVVNLFYNAGFGCGIGENRPERTGADWGTFEVHLIDDAPAEAAE